MSQKNIQQLQEELTALQSENRRLKEALKHAQASQAPSLVARLQDEIIQLKKRIDQIKNLGQNGLSKDVPVAAEDPGEVFQQVNEQLNRLQEQEAALLQSLEQAPKEEEWLSQWQQQLTALQQAVEGRLSGYETRLAEARQQATQLKETEGETRALIGRLRTLTQSLQAENGQLKAHIEDSEQLYAGIVEKLEAQIGQLKTQLQETEAAAKESQQNLIVELETQLDEEQAARSQAEQQNEHLTQKMEEARKAYEEMVQERADMRKLVEEIRQENKGLQQQMEQKARQVLQLEEQHRQLSQKLQKVEAELEQYTRARRTTETDTLPEAEDPFRSLNIFEI
ncbi:MAG: hypothetical protein D6730_16820 [Bacteroidetes bacterium]|nr:MAG: hypothetical protein D6730_16820 [Bacteroidota bacterium]